VATSRNRRIACDSQASLFDFLDVFYNVRAIYFKPDSCRPMRVRRACRPRFGCSYLCYIDLRVASLDQGFSPGQTFAQWVFLMPLWRYFILLTNEFLTLMQCE
jgi:hypothetical protein